jgi:hypothetical protein
MFDAAEMADELSEREQALRRLPLSYSLSLRLRAHDREVRRQ